MAFGLPSWWSWPLVLLSWLVVLWAAAGAPAGTQLAAKEPGDLVLGGLFPIHQKGERTSCGKMNKDRGIQRLEAMLFAIDRINEDPDLLPNITLGANILDTCSLDTYALNQSLEFIRASLNTMDTSGFECADGSEPRQKGRSMAVSGVIGASITSVSIQVANLLRLFRIPQISPASTGEMLSDKSRFDFFARTVPSDNFQVKALVDIVLRFNWSYVSTVASEGQYGEAGIEIFQREARARNICMATQVKVQHNADAAMFDEIIRALQKTPNARCVILFIMADDVMGLMEASKRANVTDFVWVASDGWGRQEKIVEGVEEIAEGALTVELENKEIEEFDEYMRLRTPENNQRNPWFEEYWEDFFQCSLHDNDRYVHNQSRLPPCSESLRIEKANGYNQDSKVQFVVDAVYAMAIAFHNLQKKVCPDHTGMCPAMKSYDGGIFYKQYLISISFVDIAGSVVEFDQHGDALGRYNIMNYQRIGNSTMYEYKVIGKWFNGLQLDMNEIVWSGGRREIPSSVCSFPCGPGEVKIVQKNEACCWICSLCDKWEYVYDEATCMDCGPGRWPYPDKLDCFDLPQQYMRWNSVYAIVPMSISGVGIVLTLSVIGLFLKNNDTPLVRASGRELSYLLLSGILFCYLMTFVLLAKPSTIICAMQRFGVGFGFSIMYSALLTKTNRISRIFDSASRSARRPGFISPQSQMVITVILISVQVIATTVWLFLEPPGTRPSYPEGRRDIVILKCNIEDPSFLVSLVYNMLLITTCTVYAVKTRNIPENFNESKFIGFTMYTTCIIWLSFIPIYFGTGNSFEVQITTLCVAISLSASVALFCLYSPKICIIVFHPDKNVRKLTMNSATYKKAPTSSTCATSVNHDIAL